jgi:hypothetical protein
MDGTIYNAHKITELFSFTSKVLPLFSIFNPFCSTSGHLPPSSHKKSGGGVDRIAMAGTLILEDTCHVVVDQWDAPIDDSPLGDDDHH